MNLIKSKPNLANSPFRWDGGSSTTKVSTEMVQTSFAFIQPTAPPSSPNLSPSKCFITSSDAQKLVKSVMDMRMAPEASRGSQCICSHTPPSEATPTEPCSPAPGRAFPANQPSAQVVTTEHVQQFLEILKSLSTQQGSPPKSPDSVKAAEGAKTDAREQPETTPASKLEFNPAASGDNQPEDAAAAASRLEFKTVDELYVPK
jgi:hypothetical protein